MDKKVAKRNAKLAVGVFVRTVVAAIIGLFLYLSVSMVFTSFATEEIGYTLWEYDSAGKVKYQTDHIYTTDKELIGSITISYNQSNGAIHKTTYVEEGVEDKRVVKDNQEVTRLYSEMPDGVALVGDILTLIGSVIILGAVPYRYLWEQGNLDRNAENTGHHTLNPLRGCHVGLLANIPAVLTYGFLWLGKLGLVLPDKSVAFYTLFNSSFLPLTYRVIGEDMTDATLLTVGQMLWLVIPVLALPVICHLAYTLGRKEILISDKIFLKSDKKKRKKRKG